MNPGIYEVSATDYHNGETPMLSSTIARVLLTDSALHAWWKCPALNPAYQPEYSEAFDVGTAVHAYLLEGEAGFEIIHHSDYRTKAAKEARDAARASGRVPLLAERWGDVQAMAAAVRAQLAKHQDPPVPLTGGKPEQTLVWQEQGVWCKARLDWLHDDHRTVDDLKTQASANPDAFARTCFQMGYDVQGAFYLRGLKAITGQEATFRFVVVETRPPYACSVVALDPSAMALAERRVKAAIEQWRFCLEENRWPGFPNRTCWISAPAWFEAQQMEKELRDDGRPIAEQLADG